MDVIRDTELGGLMMIPLFQQWRITRCNVKACKEKPTTIFTGTEAGTLGICETHYKEYKSKPTTNWIIEA